MMYNRFNGSTCFFPLRSNVGYFNERSGWLALADRIKIASLLYDHLVFEDGLYIAFVWDKGNYAMQIPRRDASGILLDNIFSDLHETGPHWELIVQGEHSAPVTLIASPTTRTFHCEFIRILQEIKSEALPWITVGVVEWLEAGKEKATELASQLGYIADDLELPEPPYLRSLVAKNLGLDISVANDQSWSLAMHLQYGAPVVRQLQAGGLAGFQAVIPTVDHLDWADIAEIREHPSIVAFREKLLEIETSARSLEGNDAVSEMQFRIAVQQRIIAELLDEISGSLPTKADMVKDIVVDIVFGFIPVPGISAAFGAIETQTAINQANISWTAAFQKIRAK